MTVRELIEKYKKLVAEKGEEWFYKNAGQFEEDLERLGIVIGSLENIDIVEAIFEDIV